MATLEYGQRIKRVYERARAKIEPRERWLKGQGFGLLAGDGGEPIHCYCLGAAIDAAAHDELMEQQDVEGQECDSWWVEKRMNHMLATIRRHVPKPRNADDWRSVVHWNDDPDTTHDDVMRVLGFAIEEAVE